MKEKVFETAKGSILYSDGSIKGSHKDIYESLMKDLKSDSKMDQANAMYVVAYYLYK